MERDARAHKLWPLLDDIDSLHIIEAIGTVAHNRRFTAVELAECCGVSREWARAVIRKWEHDGLLECDDDKEEQRPRTFFPTPAGWAIIEASHE